MNSQGNLPLPPNLLVISQRHMNTWVLKERHCLFYLSTKLYSFQGVALCQRSQFHLPYYCIQRLYSCLPVGITSFQSTNCWDKHPLTPRSYKLSLSFDTWRFLFLFCKFSYVLCYFSKRDLEYHELSFLESEASFVFAL